MTHGRGRLLSQFHPYFWSAAGFSLVLNVLMLVPPLFMLQVFDRVLASRSVETLLMLLVLAVATLAFAAYLEIIRSRILAAAGVTLERMLGPRMFVHIMQKEIGAESMHGMRDISALRAFLTGPGIMALMDAPWVPILVAVIFLFHPVLGMLALAGALVMLALAVLNEKLSRESIEAMQLDARKTGRYVDLSMANSGAARAMGMVDNLVRGWERLSKRGLDDQLDAASISSILTGTTRFMRQFLQIAMLAVGAWLVIDQQATAGAMIAGTILLSRTLAPVEYAIAGWKGLVEARGAYGRLRKLLEQETEDRVITELPPPSGALAVERAMFGFPGAERPVIKGISFQLAAGQSLAVVGPSASGKSTLARLLVGNWKPQVGAVRLDGADIAAWPQARLGRHVGYLPQGVELFSGTVSENIARMGEVDSPAVIDAAQYARVHDMILQLPKGYETPIGEGGAFLSAGQRQRIALARAVYGAPRLVVLDEPDSNLDGEGESALLELVRQLKAAKATLVIVTHRTSLLYAMDCILVLRDGAIERFAPAADLLPPLRTAPEGRPSVVAGQIQPKG